jgi:hypothetical protein
VVFGHAQVVDGEGDVQGGLTYVVEGDEAVGEVGCEVDVADEGLVVGFDYSLEGLFVYVVGQEEVGGDVGGGLGAGG